MSATIDTVRIAEVEREIKSLEATPPALVGTDEGTHGKPGHYYLYETITGERYAMHSFANSNKTRCESVAAAVEETDGYMRHFGNAEEKIREAAKRLRGLRAELKKLTKGLAWTGCRWVPEAEERRYRYPY